MKKGATISKPKGSAAIGRPLWNATTTVVTTGKPGRAKQEAASAPTTANPSNRSRKEKLVGTRSPSVGKENISEKKDIAKKSQRKVCQGAPSQQRHWDPLSDDAISASSDEESTRRRHHKHHHRNHRQRHSSHSPHGILSGDRSDNMPVGWGASERVVLLLESLFFDQYEERVTLQDLPAIFVKLGWEPRDPLHSTREEQKAELNDIVDDAWLKMVGGVPSPYVDYNSFYQVLREIGLPKDHRLKASGDSRLLSARPSVPEAVVQPPRREEAFAKERSKGKGDSGVRASSPRPRSAPTHDKKEGRYTRSRSADSTQQASRRTRSPSISSLDSHRFSQQTGSSERKIRPSPAVVEQSRAIRTGKGLSATEPGKQSKPIRASSAKGYSLKAAVVSERLYRTHTGQCETTKLTVSTLAEKEAKDLEECTFKPTVKGLPPTHPYSKRYEQTKELEAEEDQEGSSACEGENMPMKRIPSFERSTKSWAKKHRDLANTSLNSTPTQLNTTGVSGCSCCQDNDSASEVSSESSQCTCEECMRDPNREPFHPSIHPPYQEKRHPKPSPAYFQTVCRMRRGAAERVLRGDRSDFRSSLRSSTPTAGDNKKKNRVEDHFLLKKPVAAIPVSDHDEILIGPGEIPDARAISAAFCEEKGIPYNDPHRCEVERTVRFVIEQSLIPGYRTGLASVGRGKPGRGEHMGSPQHAVDQQKLYSAMNSLLSSGSLQSGDQHIPQATAKRSKENRIEESSGRMVRKGSNPVRTRARSASPSWR